MQENSTRRKNTSTKKDISYNNAQLMQFRSKTSFQTLKTIPSGSENRATGLLTQAGYIRQEMAGSSVFGAKDPVATISQLKAFSSKFDV